MIWFIHCLCVTIGTQSVRECGGAAAILHQHWATKTACATQTPVTAQTQAAQWQQQTQSAQTARPGKHATADSGQCKLLLIHHQVHTFNMSPMCS